MKCPCYAAAPDKSGLKSSAGPKSRAIYRPPLGSPANSSPGGPRRTLPTILWAAQNCGAIPQCTLHSTFVWRTIPCMGIAQQVPGEHEGYPLVFFSPNASWVAPTCYAIPRPFRNSCRSAKVILSGAQRSRRRLLRLRKTRSQSPSTTLRYAPFRSG